jgi:branched-chain amino acid transport system ATP-binding protein
MSMDILMASGLYKSYGPVEVLKDVSLTLQKGEAHVVIGPNGAGKTTLFKCLSGESKVSSGTIRLDGDEVTAVPGWRRVHRGVGRSFQVARIFGDMTAYENLIVAVEMRERIRQGRFAGMFSIAPKEGVRAEVDGLIEDLGLGGAISRPANILSHGDRKRLELAMSLALRPSILMLDEPTAGMSPADRAEAVAMIARVREDYALTLLLTEHDMEVVFGLASRLTVLHHGEIIASGAPADVRADARVREVYLGHA